MTSTLLDSVWNRLAAVAAEALRMTEAETARFRDNRIARLIGLLPFAAGCDDAERTALSHLATYVMAGRGQARRAFDHAPPDDADPFARLRTIAGFKGGDQAILGRGMALLGLCVVAGYERDRDADRALGEYNPLASNAWNGGELTKELTAKAGDGTASPLDGILTAEEALRAFWES